MTKRSLSVASACRLAAAALLLLLALPLRSDEPAVAFSASCSGRTCVFLSSGPSDVVSWDWDLGDGATAGGQNVAHIYAANGSYSVVLVERQASGQATAVLQTITVSGP